ncbi:SDR family NAD(P)-dependent oxidoreductase [Glaciecola sp. 1036]|uniref:SDR family NAD(P)-dependent oxidoreductase n=1 Tax=Alteromonadaceae TaxID=72275 RepID=UPI003D0578F9
MAKVLVTGATSGIGEAFVKKLAQEGHNVIACGRNKEKLQQLSQSPNIEALQFDVTDETETKSALSDVIADYYVLNAGTCEYVDIDQVEADMFKRVFTTNVFGAANVMAAILPRCRKQDTVVFVDSLARLLPFPRSQAYGGSKAALHYMAKSFAVDLDRKGVKVKTISPGFVETPLTDKNDFDMPMRISADAAADYMYKGIFSSRRSIYFPLRFSLMIRFLNLLPAFLQHKLCIRLSRGMKGK